MQMELKVDNGNQVKGSGHIVQRGSKWQNSRQIEGTVSGNKVELDYSGTNGNVKYLLTFVEGDLRGTGSGPKQTTFKKVN